MYVEINYVAKNRYRVVFDVRDVDDIFCSDTDELAIEKAMKYESTHALKVEKIIRLDENYKDIEIIFSRQN